MPFRHRELPNHLRKVPRGVRAVRLLRACPRCREMGLEPEMILDPPGAIAGLFHPACVLEQIGFGAVLTLPAADRLKFSLAELGADRARALLQSLEAP